MDLGCLNLGCISVSEKHVPETGSTLASDAQQLDAEKVPSASKIGKNKSPKGNGQSSPLNALNRFTSQIKKPSHRKGSPLNWFPRKKVDSYLKRKIKMLQEVDGMNLTLDETLGDSNPHYSRVLREKIAAREAAHKAMEARKAALVEASWCRILQAARIQNKEAGALLLKAEKTAVEAFEAATAMGVVMYDMTNCPKKPCQIETSMEKEGSSTTHTVTASFETAFEVDKEVAAAVKTAFTRLANLPSFNNDEFKVLLRTISQNPDMGDGNQELSGFSSECESECGSEMETILENDCFGPRDHHNQETGQKKLKRRQSFERLNMTKLVDTMLERLQGLKEEELSSLATIVATCGLNAALAEVESHKLLNPASSQPVSFHRRTSSVGAGPMELPSLDKFLVKHKSKLEKEVQEAKNSRRNDGREGNQNNSNEIESIKDDSNKTSISSEALPDLGSILVKHSCKLEKEIEEAKKIAGKIENICNKPSKGGVVSSSDNISDLGSILIKHSSKLEKEVKEVKDNNIRSKEARRLPNGAFNKSKDDINELPSLDKFLVKHVSRLEREVQEAKSNKNIVPSSSVSRSDKSASATCNAEELGKENLDLDKERKAGNGKEEDSLDKILVKPLGSRLEKEKMETFSLGSNSNYLNRSHQNGNVANAATDCESLEKVLVKHVSRLEKEKMNMINREEELMVVKKSGRNDHLHRNEEGGLDQILVKHKSRMEKEKMMMASSAKEHGDQVKYVVSRREAREKELQEAWGGLSLGNSIRPHLSKLERDKAAWIKAEEDERRRASREM